MTAPAGPVPILMYHAVADSPTRAAHGLSVTPAAFTAQMEVIAAHGFTPLTTGELAGAWRNGRVLPRRPVLITFDDGYEGVHRYALPVLKGHGFSSSLYITTGWMRDERSGDEETGAPDTMLEWGQVRELADAGTEIGAHSHTHPQLDRLTDERLRSEILRCREILTERLGRVPASFAYPYGYSSRRVRQAVRTAGFGVACAVGNAHAARRQGPYALERLTVRRRTGPAEFERLLTGGTGAVTRNFAVDRALTKGYAVVRRTRGTVRDTAGKVREAGV